MEEGKRKFGRMSDLEPSDKPREKACANGIRSLSNAELMAIIFRSGLPGKSVLSLSREILASCGNNLSRLGQMSIHELQSHFKGIGRAKAVSLAAAFELGARARDEKAADDKFLRSSLHIYQLMRGRLERINHEEFWILYLARNNKILLEYRLSQGGTASTIVDLKLVMKKAVELLASGMVLVHNHPSGNLEPSPQDDRLTKRAVEAAKLLDIKLVDHLIVSAAGYYSYFDKGKLQ